MSPRLPIRDFIVAIVALFVWHEAAAQEVVVEDEFDYRNYKFYDEEPVSDLSLWGAMNESDEARIDGAASYSNARYALSYLSNDYRGFRYSESRSSFGNMPIDYATARALKSLGFKAEQYDGIGVNSGAMGSTTEIMAGADSRLYDRQSLRVDLSGRNYIAGATYRGVYSIADDGVVLDNGWTLLSSARVRTGRDLYVEGVFTNAVDVAVGASYSGRNDKIDIAVVIPWSQRGLRQASTVEAYRLTHNTLYNPSWGMQGGRMRNSRVATSLRPEAVALWQRRLTSVTDLKVAANIYFDRRGRSSLAWFNAPTPAPDNYKYLPSYFDSDADRVPVEEAWRNNDMRYTQIDWEGMYHTNSLQRDGHARYAVASRRSNITHAAINVGLSSRVAEVDIDYGVELAASSEREFMTIDDLLGATHIYDIDYYLKDDATNSHLTENNLRNPNNRIEEGDRYNYDYRLSGVVVKLYGRAYWTWRSMDFALAAEVASEHVWRRGYFEKELFGGVASYGRSGGVSLTAPKLAASWRYNLDRHTFGAAFMFRGEAPRYDDLFLQPDYNNRRIDHPELTLGTTAELSYSYTAPRVRLYAALFVASTTREVDVARYYDDLAGEYVDAFVSGIGRLHYGIVATADVSWSRYFSSSFALNVGQYLYHRNPVVTTYADDDNVLITRSLSYMRGCHTGAPEISLYGDIAFRHKGWAARASVQFWGLAYVEPSAIRRTERLLSYASSVEEADALRFQQQLPSGATIDLSLSKYLKLNDDISLGVSFAVRNLLGSNMISSGYEQHRVARHAVGYRNDIAPFDNRITYAYPRLFSLSLSLRF